ncbi:myosin-11 [Plutella xylostella]|uniref:myosin-11 n=1 Tax=Plutella xylostella TaxID=51655 RepID=UPI002032A428|nr:myosin-11 [Plutella xylostella]
MFSKAKRFDPLAKKQTNEDKPQETDVPKPKSKISPDTDVPKSKPKLTPDIETPKPKTKITPDTDIPKSKSKLTLETDTPKPKNKITPDIDIPKPKTKISPETDIPKSKSKLTPETDTAKPKSKITPGTGDALKPKPKIGSDVDVSKVKAKVNTVLTVPKAKLTHTKSNVDTQSQCSSVRSVRSFVTPKPPKTTSVAHRCPSSLKKPLYCSKNEDKKPTKADAKVSDDIIKSQEVEIRNKDYTINEYSRQIEELKSEIANLQKQVKQINENNSSEIENLNLKLSEVQLDESKNATNNVLNIEENSKLIMNLENQKSILENQCNKLELELNEKQVELASHVEVIGIRDSLCKDLQEKLTNMETILEETKQRLEMVKGHHALALEANESIRREYKLELETMKTKLEDEKQAIINKCKSEQESVRAKYNARIESMKAQLTKEKEDAVNELQQQISNKDIEMKARLEQIDEATHEKLRICEIQFEERCRSIQEDWSLQEDKIHYLEKEARDLKFSLNVTEEKAATLQKEIQSLKSQKEVLETEKYNLEKQVEDLRDESKKKFIDFENHINKMMVEVDNAVKEKIKYEMSLSVTRDIVEVLTLRLREADDELELLEGKLQTLTEDKEALQEELHNYQATLNNTALECNEYKEALVNILKSKAALAKEHNRIMEHNVSLIESLQNVEIEAYRELGSIKDELIEDVELLKMESTTQIKMLREEVQKKRALCTLATEQAGQAAAAAEQSRALLAHAAAEIARLEADNRRLTHQIHDQQSLVVELSLLRQENEELATTVAKQTSIIDMMKKDKEQIKPKSPSVIRKTHKLGKENSQIIISPLRERNH